LNQILQPVLVAGDAMATNQGKIGPVSRFTGAIQTTPKGKLFSADVQNPTAKLLGDVQCIVG
jgi:hypothetical protein